MLRDPPPRIRSGFVFARSSKLFITIALGLAATIVIGAGTMSLIYLGRYISGLGIGIAIGVGAAWWAARLVRTLIAHLRGPWTESVEQMLERNMDHIVLVLRPFGADASIRIRKARWVLSPYVPLEDIIERAARATLEAPVYSLVDARAGVLALGPKYVVSNNEEWRESVDHLLKIAAAVVVLIPPSGKMTSSLRWEILRLVEQEFLGRTVVVLPPPTHEYYAQSREVLDEILYYFGFEPASEIPERYIVVYPKRDGTLLHWSPKPIKRVKAAGPYMMSIAAALEQANEVYTSRKRRLQIV